ncbi:hypothetical protein J6590_064298 [Homalodisca vitripennis]|nr:hypothetical protein J6590_064298 [Homalodisca vitripennis]
MRICKGFWVTLRGRLAAYNQCLFTCPMSINTSPYINMTPRPTTRPTLYRCFIVTLRAVVRPTDWVMC